MAGPVWAIVVAAGQGTRFGGRKQFSRLGDRTVVSLAVASVAASVDGVVVVVPSDFLEGSDGGGASDGGEGELDQALQLGTAGAFERDRLRVVAGGATRAASVRAGLAAVPELCEIVVVHDAARPLASPQLCEAVVAAVRSGADGAVPGIAVHDTVKRVCDGRVAETVDRSDLVRVQTPQAFSAASLRRAHEGEPEATDDAGLIEAGGGRVVVVPGEEANVKITSPDDLEVAEWRVRSRGVVPAARGLAPEPGAVGTDERAQGVRGPEVRTP